jgi:predicted outer membrane repeat protein
MSILSWLRNRKRDIAGLRSGAQSSPRRRTTFRPQLEVLEGREVPSTLKVTNLGDSGKGSLRYEIAQAQSGDTIVINKAGTITLSSGRELSIGKNLTIQGPGASLLTITSGPYVEPTRIFEVDHSTVTLSGMTISKGGGRASVYSNDYYDGHGGGVFNHYGFLTISDCILSHNNAYYGGGIYSDNALTVSGCTLSHNSAGSLTVGDDGFGGGIYNVRSASVYNSTFSGNRAALGGGIYNDYSAILTVQGSTLSGNSAPLSNGLGLGGGIYNAGTATVTTCTVSANSAGSQGGGIYNGGTLTLSQSVFSGNSPDNISGPYTDGGGNTFS